MGASSKNLKPGVGRSQTSGSAEPPVRQPADGVRRVNVDFPRRTVEKLDKEADRLGVSRQALIKVWVAERLDQVPD